MYTTGEEIMPDMAKKYEYDQKWLKENVKKVTLTFNVSREDERELYDWLRSQPEKMVPLVKRLLREEMGGK